MIKTKDKLNIRVATIGALLVIGFILFLAFVTSWILAQGVADDNVDVPTTTSPVTGGGIQNEPSNPNVNTGQNGVGNNATNDPDAPAPNNN